MKKIVAMCATVILVILVIVCSFLAHSTDEAKNVATTGNVAISIEDVFDAGYSASTSDASAKRKVFIKNTGSEKAFVRIHIAVPTVYHNDYEGESELSTYNGILHRDLSLAPGGDDQWSWRPYETGVWNMYQTTVDGVSCNVYVATYMAALDKDEVTTCAAITTVNLDAEAVNKDLPGSRKKIDNIKVLVFAEGCQEVGFENDPYGALNAQFGDPMAADYISPWNRQA